MRKIAVLFSVVLICLLCGWTDGTAAVHPAGPAAAPSGACLTLDRTAADEWLCEQEFNSDLGMPRVAAEASPAAVTPPLLRDGRCFLRLGIKCGVVCGRAGDSVRAIPEYRFYSIVTGSSTADYYVFRLRRLII